MHRLQALPLALLLVVTAAADAGPWDVVTTNHDAVTTPGEVVDVTAKFERRGWSYFRPDIKYAQVEYDLGGGSSFQTRTDRDGVSHAGVRAASAGTYPTKVRLTGKGAVADGRLFVLETTKPVVVIDIDETLSHLSSWRVPFWGADADTYPGAPALVNDLARTYTVVYLTARDDVFDEITRIFLARHGFPDGPVLYNDLGFTSWDELTQLDSKRHGDFKLAVIQAMQQRGVNVVFGIGNAETDAFAYENAGLPSFIQTSEVATGPSFHFTDYAVLRLELVARGLLP